MCKYFITKGGGGLVMPADTLLTYCSGLDITIYEKIPFDCGTVYR